MNHLRSSRILKLALIEDEKITSNESRQIEPVQHETEHNWNLYESMVEESPTRSGNCNDVRKSSQEVRLALNDLYNTGSVQDLIQQSPIETVVPIEGYDETNAALESETSYVVDSNQSRFDATPIPSPLSEPFGFDEISCASPSDHSQVFDSNICLSSTNSRTETPLHSDASSIISSPCSSVEGTPSSCRKRLKRRDEWKDIKRKCLKNLGKAYVSKKDGVYRDSKVIKIPCTSTCRLKCHQKFSSQQRENIFHSFWNLGDHTRQWDYIAKYIEVCNTHTTTKAESRRKKTLKYSLPLTEPNSDKPNIVLVCKTMFLNTLSIGERTVNTAVSKWCSGAGSISPDHRGGSRGVIIDDEIKQGVIKHVQTFQPVESHYVRKNSTKLYLDGGLTFTKMFSLYNEWCIDENITKKAKTARQYRDIINQNLNISFHKPKKDICNECHVYDTNKNNNMTEEEINKQKLHMLSKELARDLKEKDKKIAIESKGKIITACFDFQKILNCPHGNVGLFYYKRKLSVHNFTVFDLVSKEAYCYMWPEINGKHGACEVASCLLKFIETKVKDGAKEFIFWSDNCAGQNRNRIVFSFYTYAAKKYGVTITHRFLERGHTQNEADSVHALIERNSKNKLIYTPEQWYALVRWSKVNTPYYNVIEMSVTDFYNFKKLLDGKNWNKNSNKHKIAWTKIKEVGTSCNDPHILKYRYSFENEDYMTLIITKKTYSTRRINNQEIINNLDRCYSDYLPITTAKYEDLQSLCRGHIIPKEYHKYYEKLPNTRNSINEENADIDSSDNL